MSRTATARPPAEHLALLTRILSQVGEDKKMRAARRKKIRTHLAAALGELQKEALER